MASPQMQQMMEQSRQMMSDPRMQAMLQQQMSDPRTQQMMQQMMASNPALAGQVGQGPGGYMCPAPVQVGQAEPGVVEAAVVQAAVVAPSSPSGANFCTKCGHPAASGANFCGNCGAQLAAA
ncbi:unnamed protein product [Symbiodinium natans]|uniref:Zinc-ribbon domain-containing protein n=1 Tax=Symbiodinium natans TaxID=878477 RepID=A0A812PYH4_9DINO|nr:unnamed protein product [Symbiodinium natans]